MGTEYVVIKEFSIYGLSETDIEPTIFKHIVNSHCSRSNWAANCYSEGFNFSGWASLGKEAAELLRLGFIEEKVDDPVVKAGDSFDGPNGLYKVISDACGRFTLVDINTWIVHDSTLIHGLSRYKPKGIMLSEIVGKDRLKDFTPCDVKIVVED